MEGQPQNSGGMPPYNAPPQEPAPQKNIGSVIGIVVIIAVLALGGLYFWGKRLSQEPSPVPDESVFDIDDESALTPPSAEDEALTGEENAPIIEEDIALPPDEGI